MTPEPRSVIVPAPPGFYLAYKPTDRMPSGRAVAHPTRFLTKEAAERKIRTAGFDWMHVVEVK
jgi:hypothetical protein